MQIREHVGLIRKVSLFLAAAFLGLNLYVVAVNAANPTLTVKTTQDDKTVSFSSKTVTGEAVVSNLRMVNLEIPRAGKLLDNRATIMTAEGLQWDIPVIWVDEKGEVSSICIPEKNYYPVFTFYVPEVLKILVDSQTSSYSVILPEFLDGIMGGGNIVMVADPSRRITYITPSALADNLEKLMKKTIKSVRDMASSVGTVQLSNPSDKPLFFPIGEGWTEEKLALLAQDYYVIGYSDRNQTLAPKEDEKDEEEKRLEREREEREREEREEREREEREREERNRDKQQEDSSSQSGSEDSGNTPSEPQEPTDKRVSVHCTPNSIAYIGESNLSALLDLIINIIEPQAVYQLNSAFSAYSEGEKDGSIGKEISLYVYDSRVDKNVEKDIPGAVAYVSGGYVDINDGTDQEYRYIMGVNTDTLFRMNENEEMELIDYEVVNLENTITHEIMHAYMDDYNRTGMAGVVLTTSEYTSEENRYPSWFIEGISSAVENTYTYHQDLFREMRTDSSSGTGVLADQYTEELLLDYYQNYNGTDGEGKPGIDDPNNYNGANNRASAYVSGYLASLYLASLAVEYTDGGYNAVSYASNNASGTAFDSKAFCEGLDIILKMLHNGTPLDEVINTISEGKYADTADFQDEFLTAQDESVEFCVSFLNYLNDVSAGLSDSTGKDTVANGSILLPFDTAEGSAIKDVLPAGMPEQVLFRIVDSGDMVASTVEDMIALASAGTKETAIDGEPIADDVAAAAKEAVEKDEEAVVSEDESAEIDEAAEGDESAEADESVETEESSEADESVETEEITEIEESAENEESAEIDETTDAIEESAKEASEETSKDAPDLSGITVAETLIPATDLELTETMDSEDNSNQQLPMEPIMIEATEPAPAPEREHESQTNELVLPDTKDETDGDGDGESMVSFEDSIAEEKEETTDADSEEESADNSQEETV